MSGKAKGRVFFTSVPKAGKNVVYSFLFKLGYQRYDAVVSISRESAAQASYSNHFPDCHRKATYAFPPIPKRETSRTHEAMQSFIDEVGRMPEGFCISHHFAYDKKLHEGLLASGVPIVFLYRDPRDILLSMTNYLLRMGKPEHLVPILGRDMFVEQTALAFLDGNEKLIPFADYLETFNGWLEADEVLCIRFEEIIGPLGGGNAESQMHALNRLAEHIRWSGNGEDLKSAIFSAFNSKAGTFFKGQIGSWQESFTDKVNERFINKAGRVLSKWGYGGNSYKNLTSKKSLTDKEYFQSMICWLQSKHGSLHEKLNETEADSKKRLELIAERDKEINSLHARLDATGKDSIKRLELIRELHKALPLVLTSSIYAEHAASFAALVRLMRQQIHPVGVEDVRQVELESGLKLKVNLGDRLGADVYYGFYQELFDLKLVEGCLDEGSMVIDIGANFGFYSLVSAAVVGPKGRVYAFEPDKRVFGLLEENVRINGFESIISPQAACVGEGDGDVDFYLAAEPSFSSMRDTGRSVIRETVKVPLRSIDSFIAEHGSPRIDLMKIDVEGHESEVINGAFETIRRSHNLLALFEVSKKNLDSDGRYRLSMALKRVYDAGFYGMVIEVLDGRPALKALEPEEVAEQKGSNVFLVKKGSEREKRLTGFFDNLDAEKEKDMTGMMGLSMRQAAEAGEIEQSDEPGPVAAFMQNILYDKREALLECEELRRKLYDRFTLNQKLNKTLAEQRGKIENLKKELHDRFTLNQKLNKTLAEQRDKIENLKKKLHDRFTLNQKLREQIEDQKSRLDKQKARLNNIIAEQDELLKGRSSMYEAANAKIKSLQRSPCDRNNRDMNPGVMRRFRRRLNIRMRLLGIRDLIVNKIGKPQP